MSLAAAVNLCSLGLANIKDASGLAIALTGMSVVFLALSLMSGFIALLPRILRQLESRFPEALAPHGATVTVAASPADEEARVAAALAAVALHEAERS